jgi:hypothetical protein
MSDLQVPNIIDNPTPMLNNDSCGAIGWSWGYTILKKLRHLNICEVAIRDARRTGTVNTKHVSSHSNVTNIFTYEHKLDTTFYKLAF